MIKVSVLPHSGTAKSLVCVDYQVAASPTQGGEKVHFGSAKYVSHT